MRNKKTVSILLITFVSIIILMGVSLIWYFGFLEESIEELHYEEAITDNDEIADNAVAFLDAKINEEITTLINVEVAHHLLLNDEETILDDHYYKQLEENSEYIRRIEILNLEGDILYSTIPEENRVGINISNYYLFDPLTDIHKLSIGSLRYNSLYNELSIEVAYSGEEVIVYGLISIEFFKIYGEEFKQSFSDKDMMILNNSGKFLYDSKNEQHLIQNYYSDYDELITSIEELESSFFTINGVTSVVSMSSININDWKIIIYESEDSVMATNTISHEYYTSVLIGISSIFTVMLLLLAYILFNDYRRLIRGFQGVTQGIYGADLYPSRIYEINVLRNGFNEMKNKLRQSTTRLEFLAYHDHLTGLPTNNKAIEDFETFKEFESVSILYIDIKRFEVINDNYGYDFGDTFLQFVSSVLSNYLDKLYRVQSDEFIGFLFNKSKSETFNIINKFNLILSQGIEIEDIVIPINLSTGVARYPDHGNQYQDLLKKAIIAAHEVKTIPNQNSLSYDEAESEKYKRRSKIEVTISKALLNNEFSVVYQPIINPFDNTIRGFESLSRWTNEELGTVTPDEFIPILEKTQRISILDLQVIEKSIILIKKINKLYDTNFITSVNVSVDTIMNSKFAATIDSLLSTYNFNPELLELEITESTFVQDFDAITDKMKYLRKKGVKFSEDDFGDAYSSLTYLTRLEIDTLKISKNFLSTILSSNESKVLVETILDLAKKMNYDTIVEGIEDKETLKLFKELGCNFVQGYLFYRPLTEKKLLELIKTKIRGD